jgi:hypothetical protein
VREIDEIHQPKRHGQAYRQHEQQHAVGNAIEQNPEDGRQHGGTLSLGLLAYLFDRDPESKTVNLAYHIIGFTASTGTNEVCGHIKDGATAVDRPIREHTGESAIFSSPP